LVCAGFVALTLAKVTKVLDTQTHRVSTKNLLVLNQKLFFVFILVLNACRDCEG